MIKYRFLTALLLGFFFKEPMAFAMGDNDSTEGNEYTHKIKITQKGPNLPFTTLNNNIFFIEKDEKGGLYCLGFPYDHIKQPFNANICPVPHSPIGLTTLDKHILFVYRGHDGVSEGLFSSFSLDGKEWSNPILSKPLDSNIETGYAITMSMRFGRVLQ